MTDTLDLSRLPALQLVAVDYGALKDEHMALYKAAWATERTRFPNLPVYDVDRTAFDPIVIAIQEYSHVRMLDLQTLNDAGKRMTLAFSDSTFLDHVAVTYHSTERLTLVEATGDADAIMEGDDAYRLRAQLAPEATPRFGITRGGYVYTILSNFPSIKDVRPIRRGGGSVEIRVLGRDGDGTVGDATIAAIIRMLEPEDGSQSTDIVSVFAAEIDRVTLRLKLLIPRGPDPAAVIAAALPRVIAYRDAIHRLNGRLYPDAVQAAAHVGPVISVVIMELDAPTQRPEAAPWIETIEIVTEVVGG